MGGFLLEHFRWGSIFLMAAAILLPLLAAGPFLIPESRDPAPGRIDLPSIDLVLATIAPIVYGIISLATGGSGAVAGAGVIVGAGMGAVFVRRQLHLAHPLLDVRLFADRVFTGSAIINLMSVVAIVGFLFFVTQDLQLIMGFGPMTAGLLLPSGLIVTVIAGLAVMPIVARVRPAVVVAVAFGFACAGYVLVTVADTTPALLVMAFAVLGAGIGGGETVSSDLILTVAPPQRAGGASAISETAYELGAVLGTTLIGGLLTAHFRHAVTVPSGVPGDLADAAGQTLGGASNVAEQLGGGLGARLWSEAQHAFASGVGLTAGVGTVLMIGAVVAALTMLRGAPAR